MSELTYNDWQAYINAMNQDTIQGQIKGLRKAFGLTQQQLADQIGSKAPYISNIERGKTSVSIRKLEQIAEVFGLKLAVRIV